MSPEQFLHHLLECLRANALSGFTRPLNYPLVWEAVALNQSEVFWRVGQKNRIDFLTAVVAYTSAKKNLMDCLSYAPPRCYILGAVTHEFNAQYVLDICDRYLTKQTLE